jgi:hypothetical protein
LHLWFSLRGRALASACLLAWTAGCPSLDLDPDADVDAARIRRDAASFDVFDPTLDAYRDDAFLDPRTDAYLLDTNLDAVIPVSPDVGRADAPFIDAASDGGPVRGCLGTSTPPDPCTDDSECRARGLTRCNLAIHAISACPMPCFPVEAECAVDSDCAAAAAPDAGRDASAELDAGPVDAAVAEDSGAAEDADTARDAFSPTDARVSPARLACNVYQPQCACPRYTCEAERLPRCTDGFVCPENSVCAPAERLADEHGCAPKACATSADCDCGFCTSLGLCADGVGTCE